MQSQTSRSKICVEAACWLLGLVLWISFRYFGTFSSLHALYQHSFWEDWMHYLMPSQLRNGLAGFSFVSVATGLNLALVKFEAFRKSLKDIEAQWKEEIELQLEGFTAAKTDDDLRTKLSNHLMTHCEDKLNESYAKHKAVGLWWRAVAIRLSILGFACLYFQYSAGLMGIILVAPALGSWLAKVNCQRKLSAHIKIILPYARGLEKTLLDKQPERKEEVVKVIEHASQKYTDHGKGV